jgi:Fe-S-cluster containining protein
MNGSRYLDAGDFAAWLQGVRTALLTSSGAGVPCGTCNSCCSSSYFIHIRPDEAETLARIPHELLFAAPGLPEGNVVMGYDEGGRCPMLLDDACSIYPHRPHTCRIFDCRVFTATDVAPTQAPIARRTDCWRFSYSTKQSQDQHAMAKEAGRFIQATPDCFPPGAVPTNPTQVAVLAIKSFDVFGPLAQESALSDNHRSDQEVATAILDASRRFEPGGTR